MILDVFIVNSSCLPIPILELNISTHNDAYQLSWKGKERIAPAAGQVKKSFSFLPDQVDVGSRIKIKKISARFGNEPGFQVRHWDSFTHREQKKSS